MRCATVIPWSILTALLVPAAVLVVAAVLVQVSGPARSGEIKFEWDVEQRVAVVGEAAGPVAVVEYRCWPRTDDWVFPYRRGSWERLAATRADGDRVLWGAWSSAQDSTGMERGELDEALGGAAGVEAALGHARGAYAALSPAYAERVRMAAEGRGETVWLGVLANVAFAVLVPVSGALLGVAGWWWVRGVMWERGRRPVQPQPSLRSGLALREDVR